MKTLKSKYQIQEQKIIIRKVIMKSGKNIHRDGMCKVYIEMISFFPDGKRSTRRIPTPIMVSPKNWNPKKFDGSITSKDPDNIKKNARLDELYYQYCLQLQQRENGTYNEGFVAEDMVSIDDMFPKTTKYFTDYIDDYVKYRKSVNTPYNTIKSFGSLKTRIENFEKSQNTRVKLEDINLSFSDSFYAYLLQHYNTGTIHKTYVHLITVLNHFYERRDELNLKLSDKFKLKRFKRGDKSVNDPNPLTTKEFEILRNHNFGLNGLKRTKQLFLLQCTTGMRYSDVIKITPANIVDDCIVYEPQKTVHKKDNVAVVPLNGISKSILEEIGYDCGKLYISNQKYNDNIEDMFKALNKDYNNIFGDYTSHNGRDTFITFSIEAGVDIPTLLKMVGQSSYEMMKRYIKLSPEHINNSMKKVLVFK